LIRLIEYEILLKELKRLTMGLTDEAQGAVEFGRYRLLPHRRELRADGLAIELGSRAFDVLMVLIEARGALVTKDEIMARVWPDTVVEENNLVVQISALRKALGEDRDLIRTVSGRGYRFIAEIRSPVADADGEARLEPGVSRDASKSIASSNLPTPVPILLGRQIEPEERTGHRVGAVVLAEARTRPKRLLQPLAWWLFAFGLMLVLATSLSWVLYSRNPASAKIRSVAVLPLESLSGDASQDYFADGMTDELITDLGQISALRVISRTSVMTYKHVHKPLPEIARELDVDAVVEGTVLRSGERVRITAQLIRVPVERHIWAQSFEGDLGDTLVLQKTIARSIAEQVQAKLNMHEQAALEHSKVVNAEAYEAYLKGRYFWNKRTRDGLTKAIEYFNDAIQKNPRYAEAYTGLGDAYALSGDWEYGLLSPDDAFPKAKAAVTKALALDDNLAEAHTSLAFILDLYEWDWETAAKEYKRAIALNPGYATAHHWYAWHLIVMGQNAEGIAELRKAESLDPLSLIISADLADALCIAHLYDDSVQQSRKTLEMDPNFAIAHYELGQAFEQKRMLNEAIGEFQKAIELSGGNEVFQANLAYAYATSGRKEEAMKIVKDLEDRESRHSSTDASIALVYLGLGDKDQAMIWLNKAYEARFNPSILVRPTFDSLRADPRFQDLLRRIGLPTERRS
jgi:TolB-like protein/DNA-binding winged helix-turn-helix (wHTH) protein/Tfp pilus assembly protein PilF